MNLGSRNSYLKGRRGRIRENNLRREAWKERKGRVVGGMGAALYTAPGFDKC
jgi:hypothetical protein